MLRLNEEQIRHLRLRANGLVRVGDTHVAQVAARVCGLQAQERAAAELAVQPRALDPLLGGPRLRDVQADLDAAPDGRRGAVRTWAMRGTIHLLAAEDVAWLLALLGPVFVKKGQRRRNRLGLDEATCARATALLRDFLSDETALTRAELAEKLGAEDMPVQGQALYHLLYRAGLEGVICFGPDRAGEHTFVLLEDWLGIDALLQGEDPAATRLARRYLQGYGPATINDFARWSGLGMRQARNAFETLLASQPSDVLEVQDQTGQNLFVSTGQVDWLDEPQPEGIMVRFLPAYDSFLLGYESRAFIVSETYARRIHPGGGVIHPTILLNGRAVGVWRLRRNRGQNTVETTPFEPFGKEQSAAVAMAVQALHCFLQTPQAQQTLPL